MKWWVNEAEAMILWGTRAMVSASRVEVLIFGARSAVVDGTCADWKTESQVLAHQREVEERRRRAAYEQDGDARALRRFAAIAQQRLRILRALRRICLGSASFTLDQL
jgi:hypothetical protein